MTDQQRGKRIQHVLDFVSSIPHQVADAGLTDTAANELADRLGRIVSSVQSLGYPPVEHQGPDLSGLAGVPDRIAGAVNQLGGLLLGLPEGWGEEVDHSDRPALEVLEQECADLRADFTI